MIKNLYTELTKEFNQGKVRAILCSGQAVVLHGLAMMSKDGDWIVKPDQESLDFILNILESKGAVYRYGAPLSRDWLEGGWSSHLEFEHDGLRIRTDFFTKPPRIDEARLNNLWAKVAAGAPEFVDLETLALLKHTDREKDYVILGEIARKISDLKEMLKYSRSAIDIINTWELKPDIVESLFEARPVLKLSEKGREALEVGLDAERRTLMRINTERLLKYKEASSEWARAWPQVLLKVNGLSLMDAHKTMVTEAEKSLPKRVLL